MVWMNHGVDASGTQIYTAEMSELEFDAQSNNRSPTDPWEQTIRWNDWKQDWGGEGEDVELIGYSHSFMKNGVPHNLRIFND